MSLRERERLLSAENQQSVVDTSTSPDGHDLASYTMDVDTMFPPPGEEGFSFSHGAEEVLLYADLEQITTERTTYVNFISLCIVLSLTSLQRIADALTCVTTVIM